MKTLEKSESFGQNSRAGEVLPTPAPALRHSTPIAEVQNMSFEDYYPDSGKKINSEQLSNAGVQP